MNWRHIAAAALIAGAQGCTAKKAKAVAQKFCSPDNVFCIEAPGAVKQDTNTQNVQGKLSVTIKQYQWGDANDTFYIVNAIEYTLMGNIDPNYATALDKVVEGIGQRMGGSVVSKKDVVFSGLPATESIIENPKGFRMAARGLIVRDKTYVIAVGAPFNNYKPFEVERFFDSFKLN